MNKKTPELELERKFATIKRFLSQQQNITLDIQSIIYLIGLRELGLLKPLDKQQKIDVMHIATCRLLEPYGYYRFLGLDADKWPHFELIEQLPVLSAQEEKELLQEAIVLYFDSNAIPVQ